MSKRILIFLTGLVQFRIRDAAMEGFIVGGELAKINKHPHSAFLAISCQKGLATENYACGSSIINQMMLLTAAHCLEECAPSSRIGVTAGAEHRATGEVTTVKNFKIHPDYDSKYIVNDIAVVSLTTPLILGEKTKRVVLMPKPPYDKEPAVLAGWGLIDEKSRMGTLYLKETKQKVMSHNACMKLLDWLPSGTLCADSGYTQINKFGYAAEGDSGSALIVDDYIQIGVVSYKNPQISSSVVVYTDVGYFYDWIAQTVRQLACT